MKETCYPPRIERILKFDHLTAERILDIGCGNGTLSLILKKAFEAKEEYGIEIAARAAEMARDKGVNVVCLNLNEVGFPFDNDSFDMIFAGEVIEHLHSTDYFLDEIYRVLRPGGCCIITTSNLASWHGRLHLLMGWQPYAIPVSVTHRGAGAFLSRARNIRVEDVKYINTSGGGGFGHIQFFTLRALKDLLRAHGFQKMRVSGVPGDAFTLSMLVLLREAVSLIDRVTSFLFPSLASTIIIMATKPQVYRKEELVFKELM